MLSFLKHVFSFILPVTVLILVPLSIERRFAVEIDIAFLAGDFLLAAGVTGFVICVIMLGRIGRGTLAPWSPTRKLVISGPYAYVRNPMISSVLTILVSESLIFHSSPIAWWAFIFFIINNVYFMLSEEPGLRNRFGEDYTEYKKHVPRWLPRTTPWNPSISD